MVVHEMKFKNNFSDSPSSHFRSPFSLAFFVDGIELIGFRLLWHYRQIVGSDVFQVDWLDENVNRFSGNVCLFLSPRPECCIAMHMSP
jgi:hypothetical protein